MIQDLSLDSIDWDRQNIGERSASKYSEENMKFWKIGKDCDRLENFIDKKIY